MNFNLENYWLSALKCARALIEKNMQLFLRFMAKNDVKGFDWLKIFSIEVRAHSSSYNQLFQNWNSLI